MSTTKQTPSMQEYRNIPIAQLKESSTNPRKTFDEKQLAELADSIRSKGVLLPLLVRPVNGHFEIVAGECRYRASKLAGRDTIPATVRQLSDTECLEIQLIENLLRTDLHPFEEAQGFRALLDQESSRYTIEKTAAKTGKPASFIVRRLKLLDLTKPVADAFLAGHIGVEHAQLIAKLTPEVQEDALRHCFEGFYAADQERSLIPVARLQTWIEHNVYLSLQSVPFSKDDEKLLAEAGSCTNCPKRTGFNTLLFGEIREDSCADAACFNRKLDAHVAQRVAKAPGLVQISTSHQTTQGNSSVVPRRDYVEVVASKKANTQNTRPEQRLCNHLKTAIHTDGVEKGRLVKVCADTTCKIHFSHREREEKQRLAYIAERKTEKRNAKRTVSFRHRILAEVLKRVKAPLGPDAVRLLARFLLGSLSHDLACRLAKRHNLEPSKKDQTWELAEKARSLYRTAEDGQIAALLFEAVLIGLAGNTSEAKDDLLVETAKLYKVDLKTLRKETARAEKEKTLKLKTDRTPKAKTGAKPTRN
jgi:ParB family chromosome partitioning protein